MGKLGRRALVLLLAALSMSVIAACGGDDDSGDGGSASSSGEAKNGGSITMSQTSQPDFMDPALTYTVNGIEPLWLVYTPLLTYPRTGDAEKDSLVVPGLAEDMPKISKDGKTYELTLRKGLKYSDGSPVKASDFEHSVKRVLNLESGGSAFYLGITGAQDYIDAGKCDGDIKGITTDDKTGDITIKLDAPDGSFTQRAGDVVRRARAGRHALQEPDREPAPGRRSVQGHRVRAEPAVRAGEERELARPRPGSPGRTRRQDHDQDRQERAASGAGRDLGRAGLHAGPAAGRHQAGGQVEVLGPLPRDHDRFDLLHVHEHPHAALRQEGSA